MTQNLLLAVLSTMSVAFLGAAHAQTSDRGDNNTVNVGFAGKQDLFEVYPGDEVAIEQADQKQAMRWTTRMTGKHRACIKQLKNGPASSISGMRLQVKSDIPGQLWVQVNESSGEGFYKIIKAGKRWTDVEIEFSDMKLNDDKVENRKLDVDRISKIIVIDVVGLGRGKGQRSIWIANWKLTGERDKDGDQSSVRMRPQSKVAHKIPMMTPVALRAKVQTVLPVDEEERWLRIPWRTHLMQARHDSQQQAKPMLIWIMDGNVLGCT